jgi:hypothetical protein
MIYSILIGLSVVASIISALFSQWLMVICGAGLVFFFFSLQIGTIYHQYAEMAKLLAIHDKLLIAALKGMGYVFETGPGEDKSEE